MNNIAGLRVTIDTPIEKSMNMTISDGTSSMNMDRGYTIMIR